MEIENKKEKKWKQGSNQSGMQGIPFLFVVL